MVHRFRNRSRRARPGGRAACQAGQWIDGRKHGAVNAVALAPQSNSLGSDFLIKFALYGEEGTRKRHENVPFWLLDGFSEIRATLLKRMAGTTGLEPAASALTAALRFEGVLVDLGFPLP